MKIPAFITTPRFQKWTRRAVITTLTLWAVGFFIMPFAVKPLLEKLITDKYHRPVSIASISINPIILSARINKFNMLDRDGKSPLLSFDSLYVNVQARSIFAGAPIIEALQLSQPNLHVTRLTPNTYNISDIIDDMLKPSEHKTLFSLNNIAITQGRITFNDQPAHAQQIIRDLHINVPFISNLPYQADNYITPLLTANINGATVKLSGRSQPFSATKNSTIDVKLSDVDVAKYMSYVPIKLNFSVPSARLDTNLIVNFTENKQHQPALTISGTANLSQVQINQATDSVLTFKQLSVNIAQADIFKNQYQLKQLSLDTPIIHLTRDARGQLNLAQLAPASTPSKTPPAAPLMLNITTVNLTHGTLKFDDAKPDFHTQLNDINLQLSKFTTTANQPMQLLASFHTAQNETLNNTASLTLQPLSITGDVKLTGIPLQHYAPYYRQFILFTPTGTLNAATHYQFNLAANQPPQLQLSALTSELNDFTMTLPHSPTKLVHIAHLDIKQATLNLADKQINLGDISTTDGNINVQRNAQGMINFSQLTSPAPAHQPASHAVPAWQIAVHKLALQHYAVNLTDASRANPVNIKTSNIQLTVNDFDSRANHKTNVDLQLNINRTGKLTALGMVTPSPFSSTLNIAARAIDIVPMQPYFADLLNATVTDGAVSSTGKLRITANPTRITYDGNASISQFASIDNTDLSDLLKWDNLALQNIHYASDPQQIGINNIALTGLYSRLIVNPDGKLNVQSIVKSTPPSDTNNVTAAHTAAVSAPSDKRVSINKIMLTNGHINFTDHYIKPNYSANLTNLSGGVTGLSSATDSKADILINGKVDNQGQLNISGQTNPLSGNLYLDLVAKLSDFELSPLTPYAAKYAGYGIQKGKLGFEVKYNIVDKKLSAENHLTLNQLTLGDKVDNPTATKLPVTLALALLKDRNGNIDINLPISGSLDDPQFSIGGLIVKVIVNLLVKAVTSPFALIGGLFGGDSSQLSYMSFAPGSALVNTEGATKLNNLSKALADRPSLKLDIAGHMDAGIDSKGLRQLAFERLLKVQKLKQLVKDGVSITSVDAITVAPNEYANYLKLAYKAEKIADKPKIMGLLDKDIPAAQMETLMLANIKISADNLRDLALQRAQAAKEYLLKLGAIDATRIFITTAKADTDEQKKLPGNRIDFMLGGG
ncbi:MAG: DUF748 domain-containing protein [Sulfuriferula sp.]|nr:DUF748 domain-containing protein [Sulfuriferula sp.]